MDISYYCNWFVNRQRPHHLAKFLLEKNNSLTIFTTRGLRRWADPVLFKSNIKYKWRVPSILGEKACLYNKKMYHEAAMNCLRSDVDIHIYGGEPIDCSYEHKGYLIYDCMDDWGEFPNADKMINVYEEALCEKADEIWVVSKKLQEKLAKYQNKKPIRLIPNGVDVEHFKKAQQIRQRMIISKDKPILGYVGLVSSWFDSALVRMVVETLTKWTVKIIGPLHDVGMKKLKELEHERIHLLGYIPYSRLPEQMASFDVAMIPFVDNKLIQATNPIKLYEYLAAGVPTVATSMPEILHLVAKGILDCKDSPEEFAISVERMKTEKDIDGCIKCSRRFSWNSIFEEAFREIQIGKRSL